MPNKIYKYITTFVAELLILAITIIVINNFLGQADKNIVSDGAGYYDYLPSAFVYNDLARYPDTEAANPLLYKRITSKHDYVNINGYRVNKYPVGTALLLSPFFGAAAIGDIINHRTINPFSKGYQQAVFFGALFYLFIALVFTRKLLLLYNINRFNIIICQLLICLATGILHYVNAEAAFSHVYSFFAITAFCYHAKSYFDTKNTINLPYLAVILGIIILLRQLNILIVLFSPFLAGSWQNFTVGIQNAIKQYKLVIISAVIVIFAICIQCFSWYLQCGRWVVDSYQNESFDFSKPEIINILFSYKKGLFIYTPVLILSVIGIAFMAIKKHWFEAISWFMFFITITYILSSWWSWYYGCSYGLRAYIDYYTVFIIPIAILLNKTSFPVKIVITIGILCFIVLNIIQTYQYESYIIDWINMDKNKYEQMFLRTDKKFGGWAGKETLNYADYDTLYCSKSNSVTDKIIFKKKWLDIAKADENLIVEYSFDNTFSINNNSYFILSAGDSISGNYYYHLRFLVYFANKNFNEYQRGVSFFSIPSPKQPQNTYVTFEYPDADLTGREIVHPQLLILTRKKR